MGQLRSRTVGGVGEVSRRQWRLSRRRHDRRVVETSPQTKDRACEPIGAPWGALKPEASRHHLLAADCRQCRRRTGAGGQLHAMPQLVGMWIVAVAAAMPTRTSSCAREMAARGTRVAASPRRRARLASPSIFPQPGCRLHRKVCLPYNGWLRNAAEVLLQGAHSQPRPHLAPIATSLHPPRSTYAPRRSSPTELTNRTDARAVSGADHLTYRQSAVGSGSNAWSNGRRVH